MLEAFSEGGGTIDDWLAEDPAPPSAPTRKTRPTAKARATSPGGRSPGAGGGRGDRLVDPEPEDDDAAAAALTRQLNAGKTASSKAPRVKGAPTPEERADLVVMNLENFIRDHRTRTLSGMKVSDWKSQARKSVLEALIEAEETQSAHLIHTNRWILVGCATVVSIGFWAAVYVIDRDYGAVAAVLLGLLGFVLAVVAMEGFIRRAVIRHQGNKRARRWLDIRSFDSKIKRMRRDLEDTLKELEDSTEEAAKLREKLSGGRKKRP